MAGEPAPCRHKKCCDPGRKDAGEPQVAGQSQPLVFDDHAERGVGEDGCAQEYEGYEFMSLATQVLPQIRMGMLIASPRTTRTALP